MTEAQKLDILRLRSEKMPLRDIAKTVNVNFQHMIRFLSAFDHADGRVSSMYGLSKVVADTPGELDFSQFEAHAERTRAAELWHQRMGAARWNEVRKPWMG